MDKLIKFFPFMPKKGEVGKLILAIAFYLIATTIVAGIIGAVLGMTIILYPLAFVVGAVEFVYKVGGVVFAIMSFTGYDFNKQSEEAEVVVEATAEGATEAEDA